jgi:hypothetical protein
VVTSGWNTGPNPDFEYVKCSKEKIDKWFGAWAYNNYNAMCLSDPEKFRINSKWEMPVYRVPYFMLVEC